MANREVQDILDSDGRLVARAEFCDGRLSGKYESWNVDGVLIEKSHFENGRRHGEYQTWWDNGQMKESGSFRSGERVGRFVWYSAEGVVVKEHFYEHEGGHRTS